MITLKLNRRIRLVARFLRSFLPGRQYFNTPCKGSLPIKVHRQWTSYSCTASVAQMVAQHYGFRLLHHQAIRLIKCRPDGATLGTVARALKRAYGLQARRLRSKSQLRAALNNGQPVMTNDSVTYEDDHAILLIGQTPKGFWVADPAVGEVYWKHERQFLAAADEFIAVSGPN